MAYVDGFAYSIASIIMQAADRRVMGLGTSLLIHNMWMSVAGNADELRKAADDLDVLMESNRQIYMERVNITEDELIELLNNESYLTPEQAVEMGFADEVDKAATDTPDITQQLQQQLSQMRREMTAQKAFREEMRQFCKPKQKDDKDDEEDTDDNADNDNADDTDTDDEKKTEQKAPKEHKNALAALIAAAAAQNLRKER